MDQLWKVYETKQVDVGVHYASVTMERMSSSQSNRGILELSKPILENIMAFTDKTDVHQHPSPRN